MQEFNQSTCVCNLFCPKNNTYFYFYVTSDQRTNDNVPTGIAGNMTGNTIAYDGTNWYNLGDGLPNLVGDVISIGPVTTIANNSITNSMFGELITDSHLSTITTAGKVADSATSASVAATPSTIAKRTSSGGIQVAGVVFPDSGSAPLSSYSEYSFSLDIDDPSDTEVGNTQIHAVKIGNVVCIYIDSINYFADQSGAMSIGMILAGTNFPSSLKTSIRNVRFITHINLLVGPNTYTIGMTVFASNTGIFQFFQTPNSGFIGSNTYQIQPFNFCYTLL